MNHPHSGAIALEALKALRQQWKQDGKVVVWTNGCFDILHIGHIRSFQAAKALGDLLIVGINSDQSIKTIKGEDRPIIMEQERAEILTALKAVDYVVIFDESTPEKILGEVQPDIHCKGKDYEPPNGKPIPEAPLVESYGGTIHYLPFFSGHSTTNLIQKIKST